MEIKRQAFPRFYFIADDELFQLLSRSREPRAVQPHMRKLFDAIYELDFGEQSTGISILAILSQDKERVSIGPNLKARGNLEDWLGLVEDSMKKCLFKLTRAALADLQAIEENSAEESDGRSQMDWVLQHPAQCVTTVAQIMWAKGSEEAIAGGPFALSRWYNTSMAHLEELTELIRSDLSDIERKVTVALVTAGVHARDIIDTLIQQKVVSTSNFIWQAQLRYYWEGLPGPHGEQEDDVVVRQASCIIRYGYEYIGPTTRLVITPLTDRCWMTITGAYSLKLGAGPAGPAGTGKTESSKDLAKALAIFCIVFNCSDQIDYNIVGRVFSGLAQCGAWTCLDEFNRIGIEVLSVIAQQITTLRQGRISLMEKFPLQSHDCFNEVVFEGREIRLRDHHIIITMNPNYVGRTELPDNLKTHFRPCNMMIPDYALISEIIMYAEGFGHSTILSKKLTRFYRMTSAMLSQQTHYDFGMRALKSVLVIAGKMKREDPGAPEDELLIRAMNAANLPKLLQADYPLYRDLVADIFPSTRITSTRQADIQQRLREVLTECNLDSTQMLSEKIIHLNQTLGVRFGVAIVGKAGSGKTTIHTMLSKIMQKLHNHDNGGHSSSEGLYQPVVSHLINPKSISVGELYGSFNPVTQEWSDGIAAYLIRAAANPPTDESHFFRWTIFDGPIDPQWVENLNTVLDDNMLLCLASGERIKLRQEMKMLFEVGDLTAASPATVSRLGVVYIPEATVGFASICNVWCSHVMKKKWNFLEREVSRVREIFAKMSYPVAEFLRERCAEIIPTIDVGAMNTQCKIFESLIDHFYDPIFRFRKSTDEHRVNLLEQLFFHSLVWAWGAALEGDFAESFNIFVRDLLSELEYERVVTIPPSGSVFDYFVDVSQDFGSEGQASSIAEAEDDGMNENELLSLFPKYVEKQKTKQSEEDLLRNPKIGGVKREDPNPLYKWRAWGDAVPSFTHTPDTQFFDIIIPTVTTVKYGSLFKVLTSVGYPVLLTGESGCGKSVLITEMMKSMSLPGNRGGMDALSLFMHFSSHTKSLYVQRSFEKKLERKRKNLLGAINEKNLIAFVDDINVPAPDAHGSQPPIEFLRQVRGSHSQSSAQQPCFGA